ncbi:MAG: FAD-dependent oxidoreductase [Bacteroidota bacterium]
MHFPTQKYSNWWAGPDTLQPRLKKNIQADVVIVGGGFTGLYTALELRKAGVDVVVLERGHAGSEGSSKNSGYVDGLKGKDFPSLLKMYKKDRAKELCHFAKEAVLKLEDFIQQHDIACDYINSGNVMSAVHSRQIKRLKNLEAAGQDLGMHFQYLNRNEMRERGLPASFVGGIWDQVGGTVDPGKLVCHLREMAIAAGVKLYEKTNVLKVHNTWPVMVETLEGNVRAKHAVLATNAFTMQLGWKKRFMSPIWAGMFETAPLTPEQKARIGWHGKEGIYTAHEKLESYRLTARGTMIAGGKFVKIPLGFKLKNISQPQMAAQIAAVFRQRFPELYDLELATFWGGWIGIPLDFMPDIGVTGKYNNIHYGMGYAGHGVPQTLMVGEILAHNILGQAHPFGNILKRRTLPIPPEPFKWLASQLVDQSLGMLDQKTDELAAKEASKRLPVNMSTYLH